jgi:hypothetical protein
MAWQLAAGIVGHSGSGSGSRGLRAGYRRPRESVRMGDVSVSDTSGLSRITMLTSTLHHSATRRFDQGQSAAAGSTFKASSTRRRLSALVTRTPRRPAARRLRSELDEQDGPVDPDAPPRHCELEGFEQPIHEAFPPVGRRPMFS